MIPPADSLQRIARAATTPEDLACTHLTHQLAGILAEVAAHGGTTLSFDVPVLLTGFAAYDPTDVASRLSDAFREAGYRVRPDRCPWTLHLSWGAPRSSLAGRTITFTAGERL